MDRPMRPIVNSGGSPKLDNLVAQLSDINLSKYKLIENEWARGLDP